MAATNGYCTAQDLKERLGWPDDDSKDNIIEQVIETASRWIDRYCHRRFYADSANQTRYYTSDNVNTLFLNDDIVSIGTLATDGDGDRTYEDTWSATDYDLMPLNAAADGEPYTHVQVTPNGNYTFSTLTKGIQIIGTFGLACPDDIREACLLQAARYFERKDSPLGIAGVSELGVLQVISHIDSDVKLLLEGWRRLV